MYPCYKIFNDSRSRELIVKFIKKDVGFVVQDGHKIHKKGFYYEGWSDDFTKLTPQQHYKYIIKKLKEGDEFTFDDKEYVICSILTNPHSVEKRRHIKAKSKRNRDYYFVFDDCDCDSDGKTKLIKIEKEEKEKIKLEEYKLYKKFEKDEGFHVVKFDSEDSDFGIAIFKTDDCLWLGGVYPINERDDWMKSNFKPLTLTDIELMETKLIKNEKGEMKMKHVLLKTITGKNLVNANACDDQVNKYIKKFGFIDVLDWNAENETWIEDNIVGGIKFLLKKGFIEDDSKIKFNSDKLYFVKDYAGDVCRLCFDRIISGSESYRWVVMNKNEAYNPRDTFKEANEKFIENQENHHYSDFEIKPFDTLEEAMEFYYPEKKEVKTKSDDFRELRRLFEKYNFNAGCNDFEDECQGIACSQCPAGNR